MNNTMKIGLMPLLVFTVIAIGLFGISIAPTVEVFAGKKDYCKTEGKVPLLSVGKTGPEKCSNWDPRC